MSMQLINGQASESAAEDGFFDGTVSPRRFQVAEAFRDQTAAFMREAFAGRKSEKELREAFSTSDFTLAAYAQVDSETLQQYQEQPSVWRQYTDITTVNDFRPKRLMDRWSNILGLKLVPELTEYPTGAGQDHENWWINVAKYGLRDAISFEAMKNNEAIDELEAIPTRFARAAAETETINALANLLKIDPKTNLASDVNTDFFKTANGNAPTALPLTAANLDTVLTAMAQRKSRQGRHVARPQLQVVIPTSLEPQMQRIQALREIRETDGTTESVYDNFLRTTDYVVEPMLDVINTNAKAATTWFVLPKPGQARPASFAAFLRGYETPDLRVKVSTGQRVGGGNISPLEGSFEVDDIQHRVRHIVGHQHGDPTFTYVSRGS
ncbi:hypothetical protein DT076_16625 [Desertihabitans brevis]|uniref:Bacteriophage Mu GpT domain-containing protein n=1 Tax=Desertihabitans brevis TaxID=2268447 RepID=A0A367YQV9_9ACTN|nr:hypothetical protein [Desertihabitans brevis]RCK68273.1 hypothetical protein DT076_16625 [Desertihabitans brevis]